MIFQNRTVKVIVLPLMICTTVCTNLEIQNRHHPSFQAPSDVFDIFGEFSANQNRPENSGEFSANQIAGFFVRRA